LSRESAYYLRPPALRTAACAWLAFFLPLCPRPFRSCQAPEHAALTLAGPGPWRSALWTCGHVLLVLGVVREDITGEYDRAGELLEAALRMDEACDGRRSANYASTLHSLANVRREQQRHEEAARLYAEALEIYAECVGRQTVTYADTLHSMGIVRDTQQRHAEALQLKSEALEIYEACAGRQSAQCAGALNGLACSHLKLGQHDEALALVEEALHIYEALGLRQSADCGCALGTKGAVWLKQERQYDEALELVDECLHILESHGHRQSCNYAEGLNDKGEVRLAQRRYAEALQLFEEAQHANTASGGNDSDWLGATICDNIRLAQQRQSGESSPAGRRRTALSVAASAAAVLGAALAFKATKR